MAKFKRYDRADPDWRVLKLVSVSHHIWAMLPKLTTTVSEREAFLAALETIWRLKRELKEEIAIEKQRKFQEYAKRLPAKATAKPE
jgi:hypothetical protein